MLVAASDWLASLICQAWGRRWGARRFLSSKKQGLPIWTGMLQATSSSWGGGWTFCSVAFQGCDAK